MILTAAALSLVMLSPQQAKVVPVADDKPITLSRTFTKGEKLQYGVTSNLHIEVRERGLETFLPMDEDLAYKFTMEVTDVKSEGVATIHYKRPVLIDTFEQTFDKPETKKTIPYDWDVLLTVSPVNKILDQKDLAPKKKPKPAGDGDGEGGGLRVTHAGAGRAQIGPFFDQFIGEVERLAASIGPVDLLDVSPPLPLDDVKVGDTWATTVGYQPQQLKGKDGKQAVQRLDYTLTYKGIVTVNGKKYYRINAALNLNADLASFVNQMVNLKPEQTHLKSIPLTLQQNIDYDLDMTTKRTVMASSKATGGFNLTITDFDEPVREEKISGTTELKLLATGTATPVKHVAKR